MGAEVLLDALTKAGFTDEEARVYVRLATEGPLRARDVSSYTGLARPRAYRVLDKLAERGFVTPVLTRPLTFQAIPPHVLFDRLIGETERRLRDLNRLKDSLPSRYETPAATRELASRPSVRIVQGRENQFRSMEYAISTARKRVLVAIGQESFADEWLRRTEALLVLGTALEKGVTVQLLLPVSARRRATSLGTGPLVRTLEGPRVARLMIVDDRWALTTLRNEPESSTRSDAEVAMISDSSDFVKSEEALFEALWAGSAREEETTPDWSEPPTGRG